MEGMTATEHGTPATPDHDGGHEGHEGHATHGGDAAGGATGHDGHLPDGDVPSLWEMFTTWDASWGWTLGLLAIAGIYLFGVVLLRRRGDAWSWGRTVSWLFGVLTLALVTGTGVWTWGMALFSTHMVQHMVVGMLTPIFLVAAAPVTLLLRALPARGAGAAVRRGVLGLLHSRYARVMTSPVVTVGLFVASLYVLYFTPLLDLAMATHTGHVLMVVHFIAVGVLFFGPIIAVDPWPRNSSAGARLLEMLVATPFHAFFAVAVMSAGTALSNHYLTIAQSLGVDAVEDQRLGGGIAWASGEIPILVVAGFVFAQWIRDDQRAARRLDRAAARDGDADLKRYNEALAAMHAR